MSRIAHVGEVARASFPVFESDGYTKHSGAIVFSTTLWVDGVVSGVLATIIEIGSSGEYLASFTPNSVGVWRVEIKSDYDKAVWAEDFDVSVLDGETYVIVGYDDATTTLYMETWLERSGLAIPQANLVSCTVRGYNVTGTLVFTATSSSPRINGRFSLTQVIGLTADQPYNLNVEIVDSLGTVTTFHAFTAVS